MKKGALLHAPFRLNRRDEAIRTPDPYVPNVVRYQLRYIPIAKSVMRPFAGAKIR